MEIVKVKAESRNSLGTKFARAARKEGSIPCVIYGGGEVDHCMVKPNDVKGLIYTPNFKLAEIDLEGKSFKCIIKDLQVHPVTDVVQHIDFLKLVDGATINVELPVRFKGTSPGVKEGGALIQTLRRIKVKTTPEDLIDELLVDISHVLLGQAVRVKDLELNDNIQIMADPNMPIASVEVPRALKSAEAGAEEAAEAAEGAEGAEGGEAATDGAEEAKEG